jgi:hypothetical protein
MICAFPEIFCVKDKVYGERGPIEGKEDEEDDDREKREKALIKAVLKKGNAGKRFASSVASIPSEGNQSIPITQQPVEQAL